MTTPQTSINPSKATKHANPNTVCTSASQTHKTNNWLAYFIGAVVGLSPILFGSNSPPVWALSASLIGLVSCIYFFRMTLLKLPLRFSLSKMRLISILFCIFLTILALQVVPVGIAEFKSFDGFSILSHTLSISPGETTLMLVRQLGYGLFFLLVLQVSVNRNRARKLLLIIFGIATIHSLIGLISLFQLGDTILLLEKTAYYGAATGTFINKNSYATFLAMGAMCGMTILLEHDNNNGGQRSTLRLCLNLSNFVALAIIVSTVLATQSRMGALVMTCGIVFIIIPLSMLIQKRKLPLVLGTVFAAVCFCGMLAMKFGLDLFERISSTANSLDIRNQLYEQVFEMSLTRPLLGFGGGSFNLAYPLYHRPPVSPDRIWDKAHSTYLSLWSELGYVIGSIPILIFIVIGIFLLRTIFSKKERTTTSIAAFAALVVVALHSFVDFSLEIQANTYMFLAIVGLGFAGTAEVQNLHTAENDQLVAS